MGYKENSRTVRGSGGTLRTNATGVMEVDNYTEGGAFNVGDGSNSYPHTVNPMATIQELVLTETGTEIVADLTTKTGDTLTDLHLRGAALASDTLEIDKITFKDPNATGTPTFGYWVGE